MHPLHSKCILHSFFAVASGGSKNLETPSKVFSVALLGCFTTFHHISIFGE